MDAPYDASRPTPQPWNILNFYAAPAKNDPWVFPRGVIQTDRPSPAHLAVPPAFHGFRSRTESSDCATMPGDSGYSGSRQAHSTASTSVHGGDDLVLDAHMGQAMSECHINPDPAPAEPTCPLPPAPRHRCDDCNAHFRRECELKKHRQRHLKSHKCPYPDCKGQRGFSTSNDLVRHRRSVHGEHRLPGRSFVCNHCAPGPKGLKIWPRADNFRSHLFRTHRIRLSSDDDHTDYIYQHSTPRHDLKGVGDSLDYVDSESRPMCLQESETHQVLTGTQFETLPAPPMGIDPALFNTSSLAAAQTTASNQSAGEGETPYIHPAVLGGQLGHVDSMGDLTTPYPMQRQTRGYLAFQQQQPVSDGVDGDARPSLSASSSLDVAPVARPASKAGHGSLKRDESTLGDFFPGEPDGYGAGEAGAQQCRRLPDDGSLLHTLKEGAPGMGSDPSEIILYLTRFPKELLQAALRTLEDLADVELESVSEIESGPKCQIKCPDLNCDKSFGRLCELNKHMKRHNKPYGCTFKSCSKRFGSKNDWKRHESSQHYMLEQWDCDEPDCGKIFQRRESFKYHLHREHGMEGADMVDKLESYRLGRHSDPRFWCGFCVRVIQVDPTEGVGNTWTKRCDHIDGHLSGKGGLREMSMGDWKHQEDQQPGSEPVEAERKRNNS